MRHHHEERGREPVRGWDPFAGRAPIGDDPDDGARAWEFFATIRRHLALTAAVAFITLAPIVYLVISEAPRYKAEGMIRLVDARRALTGGLEGSVIPDGMIGAQSDAIRSQIEVLRGRVVLGDVVDRTGLRLEWLDGDVGAGFIRGASTDREAAADTLRVEFREREVVARAGDVIVAGAYGEPISINGVRFSVPERPETDAANLRVMPRGRAIDELRERLATEPQAMTDAVLITYSSEDPIRAQEVVNTLITTFQLANAEAAQQLSRRRRIFLDEQLASADSLLSQAQLALSDFRSREQVYSSSEKLAAQQQGLMTLEAQREEIAADRRMFQTLFEQLRRQDGDGSHEALRTLVSSPGIASNAVISQLYFQLTQYEASRDSLMSGSLGSTLNHPEVQRLTSRIELTRANLVDAVRSHLASLEARIEALDGLVGRNAAEIALLPAAEAEEFRLIQQMETSRKVADQLREELYRARMSEAVEAGQVEIVYPAPLPLEPENTGKLWKLGFGIMVGMMFGAGGAFLKDRMNNSIRRRKDVEHTLRVPGLAVIPSLPAESRSRRLIGRPNQGGTDRTLITLTRTHSIGAEAYRTLRTNLLFSQDLREFRSVLVTSAGSGEGKTTTAANLAVTLAQQGRRVVLIDCDLRRARMHHIFQVPGEPGVAEVLAGTRDPQGAIVATSVPNLFVLPAGALPANPSELLGGIRTKQLIRDLERAYDLVVIDTPPLLATSDAAVLGSLTDGAVMVVRAGQTDRAAAQDAIRQMQAVGAHVIGAVLNDPDSTVQMHERYYGKYHKEYYGAAV